MSVKSTGMIVCVIVLTASCSTGPVHVEKDFGSSVRQMVAGQISDPAAAADPSSRPAGLLDGVSAEEALSNYRKGTRREGDAGREIRLSVE